MNSPAPRTIGIPPLLATIIALLALVTSARAQTAPADSAAADTLGWHPSGTIGANFTTTTLSNWAAGGKNSITATGLTTLSGIWTGRASSWENSLDAGLGYTRLGSARFEKSDDRWIIVSKYNARATDVLDYSALLDIRSQFADGFNYDSTIPGTNAHPIVSRPFSPAIANIGIGVTYKPVATLAILLAPISNQLTLVLDDRLSAEGAFGVEPGKKVKSELGSLLNVTYDDKELATNVALKSRLNVFAAYEHFTTAVVTWETVLNLKVNSFLNASVGLDVQYDESVDILRDDGTHGPATQLRNVIAVGLAYKIL